LDIAKPGLFGFIQLINTFTTEWLRTGTFYSKNTCPQGRW
jgi:hypothetical protein